MVEYEQQLQFFKRMIGQLDMSCMVVSLDGVALPALDMGLRSGLGKGDEALRDWYGRMRSRLEDPAVFFITDEFQCRYITLLLYGARELLVVGPYTTVNVDREWITEFMAESGMDPQWLPILEAYYHRVRYLPNDKVLAAAVHTLAEYMWGAGNYKTEHFTKGVPDSWAPLNSRPGEKLRDDILDRVRLVERRYEAESRLMELVAQGRAEKIKLMLGHFSRAALERRADPTRDVRNYSIILNTLMRKATQQGGVHPVYIDRISSEFARRIESITRWEDFMVLWSDMAVGYCGLVRRHATARYSPMIRKAITRIDFDLAADLSLRAMADALSVNASYLSNQFKQETGETLTDHVSRKRMEHAVYLLSTTDSPVSSVAQSCGIADDNYFARLFKRYNGKTPTQFRQEQRFSNKK